MTGTAGQAGYRADEYFFDGLGRMIAALAKSYTTSLNIDSLVARYYDKAGRITGENQYNRTVGTTRGVQYPYNDAGHMTRIHYLSGNATYRYTYNDAGNVLEIGIPNWTCQALYTYVGRRVTQRYRDCGPTDSYEYDGLWRLTRASSRNLLLGTFGDYARP